MRLRAAWLYYNHKLTQKEIAAQLGLSRTTVVGLLEEALKRSEVQIWINEGDQRCVELALRLEKSFRLDEVIVVPHADQVEQAARSVGLALGRFLSEAIVDHMAIGVGWGRTLTASLASFRPPGRQGVKIISLLGGIMEARTENPVDYSWRLASQLGAACFLYPAPLLVDSAATKQTLREKCGLDRLDKLAASLDVAVFSVGEVTRGSTSLSRALIEEHEYREIIERGGACDVMCNFLDEQGNTLVHPINERVMSVDLSLLAKAAHLVIACGGARRADAIRAAIRRVGCHTLITDEGAAHAMLASL